MLCICLVPRYVLGQREGYVQGQLKDVENKEAIAFATIRVEGKALGVISNADGSFQIPLRFREEGEYLLISSMGYENLRIPIASLRLQGINQILLHPRVFKLTEAILEGNRKKSLSARKIVRTALKNILVNNPTVPFGLIGYYRDYQMKGGRYVNLNEAILEILDQGFGTDDLKRTRVHIFDYHSNDGFQKDTLAARPYDYRQYRKIIKNAYLYNYGGNEFTILRIHDAVRNFRINTYSFVERLSSDFLGNHAFKRVRDTYFDHTPYYTRNFKTEKSHYRAQGSMVISPGDFSIYQLNYALYDRSGTIHDGSPAETKNAKEKLVFEIRTEYQKYKGLMYLNYISFRNNFELIVPPRFTTDSVIAFPGKGFQVFFNKSPDPRSALDIKNYKVAYKGESIELMDTSLKENSVLITYDTTKHFELRNLVKYTSDLIGPDILSIEVHGIRDKEGNLVNSPQIFDLLQFREFFTQEIQTVSKADSTAVYMFKDRPIFQDQPISRPGNFGDYWMNTPLQKAP